MLEIVIVCLFLIYFMSILLSFILHITESSTPDLILNMNSNNSNVPNPPSDIVRWWPSGVPQSGAAIATGIGAYVALSRVVGLTPRGRLVAALAAAGITTTNNIYYSALENSVGFNRFMWGITEHAKTGKWPSLDEAYRQNSDSLSTFAKSQVKNLSGAEQAHIKTIVDKVEKSISPASANSSSMGTNPATGTATPGGTTSGSSDLANSFVPSSDTPNDLLIRLYEKLFKDFMQLFPHNVVQGHFDDLLGQRIFIEFLLFLSTLFVFILFILFIFNLILLFNKDRIIGYFKNKFIL